MRSQSLHKWFTPGLGVKRWLLLLTLGIWVMAGAMAASILKISDSAIQTIIQLNWIDIVIVAVAGIVVVLLALLRLSHTLLTPYRRHQHGRVIDVVYAHSRRAKGLSVVAIGGGTGMPSVLRSLKAFTSNITAIVTVADDGGSSGRLRRELGVLPPGDLRNNIAALADDESLMTQLFQYRFSKGALGGHAFGNLFIAALAGVTGSLESALIETERVLNIQGRVLPATLEDVVLVAAVRLPHARGTVTIHGETSIIEAGGIIEKITLSPEHVEAFGESVAAIENADIVIVGPGSLYTSILPNILIDGIGAALKRTNAYKIYVCNIATQPGETTDYNVADHVLTLEHSIGRGVFQLILANNAYPLENAGVNTQYVQHVPIDHEILQRYRVQYKDLVDDARPWRHDPQKLARAVAQIGETERLSALASLFAVPEI